MIPKTPGFWDSPADILNFVIDEFGSSIMTA